MINHQFSHDYVFMPMFVLVCLILIVNWWYAIPLFIYISPATAKINVVVNSAFTVAYGIMSFTNPTFRRCMPHLISVPALDIIVARFCRWRMLKRKSVRETSRRHRIQRCIDRNFNVVWLKTLHIELPEGPDCSPFSRHMPLIKWNLMMIVNIWAKCLSCHF